MSNFKLPSFSLALILSGSVAGFVACGGGADGDADTLGAGGSGNTDSSDDINFGDTSGGGDSGMGGSGPGAPVISYTLPERFTPNVALEGQPAPLGGWRLIGALGDVEPPTDKRCGNILRVLVRDMQDEHPDFGSGDGDDKDIVKDALGADRKPVFDSSTKVQSFDDWYRNVDGVNLPFVVHLWLEPKDGTFIFDSGSFFPLDYVGYGLTQPKNTADDGQQRAFLFTTELHTKFQYKGGEDFTFRGDDDVFVFIDGELLVDLGGIHEPQEGSVQLDDLGLEVGEVYTFDLFQAERKPTGSNFRMQTTLDFTECGEIVPDVPVK